MDILSDVALSPGETMGPIQTIPPTSNLPPAWLAPAPGNATRSAEEEENEYFKSALFSDVFECRPKPDDIQIINIVDRNALVDFFPSFENTGFKDLTLEDCSLSHYPTKVGLHEPGLYFQTDLVLGGHLQSVSNFMKMFLSETNIRIRLSAYLGSSLSTGNFNFDRVTLSGCLSGLKVGYPPGTVLLQVISAGVRITFENRKETSTRKRRPDDTEPEPPIKKLKQGGSSGSFSKAGEPPKENAGEPDSKEQGSNLSRLPALLQLSDSRKLLGIGAPTLAEASGPVTNATDTTLDTKYGKGKSQFSVGIFGNLLFRIPFGSIVALQMEYTAQYDENNVSFVMVLPQNKQWVNAFGVENLHLDDIVITAEIPTDKANRVFGKMADQAALDEGFACNFKGSWPWGDKIVMLTGEIHSASQTQSSSFIQAQIGRLTWKDLSEAAKILHGYDVKKPDRKLEFKDDFVLCLLNGAFQLSGYIELDDATFKVDITISTSGVYFVGSAENFRVPDSDVIIKEACLDLTISRQTKEAPKLNVGKPSGPDDQTGDTAGTSSSPVTGASKKQAPEASWYFGFKVSGVLKLTFGSGEARSVSKDYKLEFAVTFSLSRSNKGRWEALVAGKARTTVYLRNIINEIPADSLLDAKLSDFTFIGTNADNPDVPKEIAQFPIKKGFFLCASLERVPLIEEEGGGGKLLKKNTATDRAYLRIGYQKGEKLPKIKIFLPPSFKIDFGERFQTGAIFLEIDAKSKPICKFLGEMYMRMNDNKGPIKFVLGIAADHLRGSLELVMDAPEGLKGPLGLSDRIVIYQLKGSVEVIWQVLLSSGTISGFGFGGTFSVDEDHYVCELRMAPTPSQNLININAKKLGTRQLVNLISAVINKDVDFPPGALDVFQMQDVIMYCSSGCTWLDTYYPEGFRFSGIIKLWDFEAFMKAEVNNVGLYLHAKIKGFQVGPLKIRGARTEDEDAELEVTISPVQQSVFVTGRIEIFSRSCSILVDCQFMPLLKFEFRFELTWNTLLKVKVYAKRNVPKASPEEGQEDPSAVVSTTPAGADWDIYALVEQSIVAEIKQGIISAIDSIHQALEKGIGAAHGAVAKAQQEYDDRCRQAQAALDAKYQERQEKMEELDRIIETAKNNLIHVKDQNRKRMDMEESLRSSKRAQGERDRDIRLEPVIIRKRKADEEVTRQEADRPHKIQQANRDRDEKRTNYFAKFGDAKALVNNAIRDVDRAEAEVDRLSGEVQDLQRQIDNAKIFQRLPLRFRQVVTLSGMHVAKAGLQAYKGILHVAQAIEQTDLFKEVQQAMQKAEEYLNTVGEEVGSALEKAGRAASKACNKLEIALMEEKLTFASLVTAANDVYDIAKDECADYERETTARKAVLDSQRTMLGLEIQKVGFLALKKAVELAQKNNIALLAAKEALEAVDALEKAAYGAIKGFVSKVLDKIIDVQKVELKGVITGEESKQEAFQLTVKGQLDGRAFEFTERWMPGKSAMFLAKVGLRAVAEITDTNMDDKIDAIDREMIKRD